MFDVAILGAGPAGAMAAARCSELGARTALVSAGRIGGMAANDGPVPVRTLARTARLLRESRRMGRYGITVADPVLDYRRVLARVGEVAESVRTHSLLEQVATRGAILYESVVTTRFLDAHHARTASGQIVTADRFIIATGGVSRKLPIPGFELTSTHSDAWSLTDVPESMVIVGAGATGIQLASVFNAFGSRIELFEAAPRILAAEDDHVAAAVRSAFRDNGIALHESFGSIESFEKTPRGVRMNVDRGGAKDSIEADLVVVAVGWTAATTDLNLAAAGVELGPRGFIAVDDHLQTSAPNIFAAGDVTGRVMLASEALRDGFVAADNAMRGPHTTVGHHTTLAGSFTDPEYASIGLTEQQARAQYAVDCTIVGFTDNIRAIIDGETFGFCKLVVRSDTYEVLGCHVVGNHAIDVVQVVSAALSAGMRRVDELARVSVSFPTYAQIVIQAAVRASSRYGLDIGWHGHAI